MGVCAIVASLGACGGTEAAGSDSGVTPDTGVAPPDDGGGTNDTGVDGGVSFPAPFPAPPQVVSTGGPVLSGTFKIVPVFYSSDSPSTRTSIEAFLNALPNSTYWDAISKEYGVGEPSPQTTVVLTAAAPSSISDNQIRSFIASQADGAHSPWPKADANTIFAMFYPQGTTVTMGGGTSCQSFGAYHGDARLADNTPFAYAVMPRCPGGVTTLTSSASHEFIEAATDPFPQSNPAYSREDDAHIFWSFATSGGEVADMCEADPDAFQPILGNFWVQRSWSNKAAKAGHDPCVPPLAKEVYFAAAPALPDTITLNFGQMVNTKGVKIPVGQSRTIDVDLFSDAPRGPWTVSAAETRASGTLSFSWDATQGQNGDVLHLTIKVNNSNQFGAAGFSIKSMDSGGYEHMWYGLVGIQ